ncbi:DUF5672 family protein [Parapedobacter tibetensis]|uniref:DUF5672 family protein n=1 Tax=Parapedobacter tibetensis TaxID=2972951 RepID=UPI00214D9301|nr:DUF5672 family protein [Parapedobacter tibetensis]
MRSAIIIPLYKEVPTNDDIVSLTQCFKVLHSFPKIAVTHHHLSLNNYPFLFDRIERFDSGFFESIAGYNCLMLSSQFYERFVNYHFILVHQTDAFVFNDRLDYWMRSGYDYIGAPWYIGDFPDVIKMAKDTIKGWVHRKYNIKKNGTDLPTDIQFKNQVGNGGLSLRNIEKFYKICVTEKGIISSYLSRTEKDFNEDAFWSIEVNRTKRQLKIPDYKTALHFAIESEPRVAMNRLRDSLPFGCHAWDKNDKRTFWRPIFSDLGYEI